MTTSDLTSIQQAVLSHAIHRTGGRLEWFPDQIKGGARKKVLEALLHRGLINHIGDQWLVAAAGYSALGVPQPESETAPHIEPQVEPQPVPVSAAPRSRQNSKQATVVRMLKRPEGATIAQICEATGWQGHTVRGTLAGALKRKLGLAITSDKVQGAERVYRIPCIPCIPCAGGAA